jgi:hypothetical protein
MRQSDWEESRAVQERTQRLVERTDARSKQAARVVELLAMFSAADAQAAQVEVRDRLDAAFGEVAEALVRWVDKAIEDRVNDQEDWDSSTNIHLLNRLRQDAAALAKGDGPIKSS